MRFFSIVFLFCFLLSPYACDGQQYNFSNYNVENGLAQSQVFAIHQDSKGYLWLGTQGGGISLFDGFEFKNITTKEGLSGNYINKIVEDDAGIIWIATTTGLTRFDGKEYQQVLFGETQKRIAINDIYIAKDGAVFCASDKGLFRFSKNKKAENITPKLLENKIITCVFVNDKNKIWAGTEKGLFPIENDQVTDFSEQSRYMSNGITTIRQDAKGNYWIGTNGDGMYCYNGDKFDRIDPNQELYKQTIFDIHFNKDEVWFATLSGGVIQYNSKKKSFNSITDKEGLSNNHVRCIFKDINASYWFGTSGGGVCQYLGKQFTRFNTKDGLAGNYIYSILRDKQNNLWVGNSERGVSVLSKGKIIQYNANNLFFNVKVKALAEDKTGAIWLGTNGRGVYVFQNEKFELIEELKTSYVKQIKVDAKGSIWIATTGAGLIEIERKEDKFIISKWTTNEGLLSDQNTAIHFDKKGRLWYGTKNKGLACLSKSKKQLFHYTTETEELPSDAIRALTEDERGNLWVGTAGNGVCSLSLYKKKLKKKFFSQEDGLASDNIYLLEVDKDGSVVVGSEKGLDFIVFNKNNINTRIRHYGKRDGFTGVETCQNAVWKDVNGSMWFGTINGLFRYDPSELIQNEELPVLSITDIKLFYESYDKSTFDILKNGQQTNDFILPYSQNHITFEFLGLNLRRPTKVRYRWKLKGFDEEFSPPSKEKSILYSNLNPGEYVFELIAANENNEWSQPLSFRFEIESPFWKTTWFITAMIFLGLLLPFIVYRMFVQRIKAKALATKNKMQLEKDFLELEQKAMRLQMNPHFIFNALNSIQGLIGTGKEVEARYYLAKFSRLMRQILDNSRKHQIHLEEEINTLENYLLVEQFCNGNKFNYEIIVDPNIEIDFIDIPPMIIQPFVENAIKHGMKGKTEHSEKGSISVRFLEKGGYLECIVEDDGVGREKSAELNELSKETYHQSTGLEVTIKRLKRISSLPSISPLEIIDLYEKGVATGTKVIIRIPIE